jgi:hypothetical protein
MFEKQHYPYVYDLLNVYQLMLMMFQEQLVVHLLVDYLYVAVVVVAEN